MSPRYRALSIIIGLLALAATAGAIRCASYPDVFTPQGVLLYGNDSYYHLRRVTFGAEAFPSALTFDPYLRYPRGARAIWPLAFDQATASVARVSGARRPDRVLALAVILPPILGVLAVLVLFVAGRALFSSLAVGGVAAVWLTFIGAAVHPTRIGFIDHHAAMGLLVGTALLAGTGQGGRARVRFWSALVLGGVLGASVLVWTGCLVLIGAWAVTLALAMLAGAPRSLLLECGVTSAFAGAAVLTAGNLWEGRSEGPALSLTLLSWLQPLVVLAIGLLAAAVWAGLGKDQRRWRATWIGGLTAAGIALVVMLLPGARAAAEEAVRWVTKAESFQSRVAESEPILFQKGQWTLLALHGDLSWLALTLPFAALWVMRSGWRERAFGRLWLVTLFGVLAGLTLLQRRFVDLLAVPAALILAFLTIRAVTAGSRLRGGWVAVVLIALVSLVPCLEIPWFHLGRALASLEGSPPRPLSSDVLRRQLRRTARWIRESTPETSGWLEPDRTPEYGIAAFWDLGHLLRFYSRRPMMVDNFGDDLGGRSFEDSLRLHRVTREPESEEILEKYGIRYWVTRELPRVRQGRRRVADRLHRFDGKRVPVGAGWLPALRHFRLVHESLMVPSSFGRGREKLPAYKVWERVPGARLVGEALPGERVTAFVDLETNIGRRFRYRRQVPCDAAGRFEIVVPYPTEAEPHHVKARGACQVSGESFDAEVRIAVRDVREGRMVRVPTGD